MNVQNPRRQDVDWTTSMDIRYEQKAGIDNDDSAKEREHRGGLKNRRTMMREVVRDSWGQLNS